MTTTRRFVFGMSELDNGITFIVAIISLLALSEVFLQVENTGEFHKLKRTELSDTKKYTFSQRWKDFKFTLVDLLRSSFLGSLLGALPGIGATTASLVSYGESRRAAKEPSMFGNGDPRGIAASESGNNAVAASSLIPLITLGIPGSVAAAVMFGAFMVQGMIPGPMLMQEHPEIIYGLFVILIVTDILGAFLVALPYIALVRRLFKTLDYTLLFPGVIVCCTVGVYSEEFDPFGLKVMLMLGFLGYLMKKARFSIPPLILAFILGPILERNTRTALLIGGGSPMVFVKSPIALSLLVLTGLSLFWAVWKKRKKKDRFIDDIELPPGH
jgi:putative tricarboxylic transport membrane protein